MGMGADVSSVVLENVDSLLQAEREVNFIINVVNPTRTDIDVAVVGIAYPEWILSDVRANIEESITDFLSPSLWGLPRFGDQLLWLDERVVRYLDLVTAIGNTEGLNYVTSVRFAQDGNTLAQADINIDGIPPLPRIGDVTVAVTHA